MLDTLYIIYGILTMIPSAVNVQPQQTHNEQETSFIEAAGTSSNYGNSLEMTESSDCQQAEISSGNHVVLRRRDHSNNQPEVLGNPSAIANPSLDRSSSESCSTSTDSDEIQDQALERTTNRVNTRGYISNDNVPQFVNEFTGNKNLHTNFHTTRIIEGPVTMNFYCCSSALSDGLKSYLSKCCVIRVIGSLMGILIIICLCMWFLNTNGTKLQRDVVVTSTESYAENLPNTTDFLPTIFKKKDNSIGEQVLINEPIIVTSIKPLSTTEGPKNRRSDIITSKNPSLRIITRDEWDATPPNKPFIKLDVLPAHRVIISETFTESCDNLEKCRKIIHGIERRHISSYPSIPYNFLISSDGLIYEGRGWDVKGEVVYNFDRESISIAFIGNFSSIVPLENQAQAASKLIRFGVDNGHIDIFYKLKGQKQLAYMSNNPGIKLYTIITKWQQWEPGTIGIDFVIPSEEYNETMNYKKMFSGTRLVYIPKRGRN